MLFIFLLLASNRRNAVASVAGGLEGPGTLWVSLQNPFFSAGCGGRVAITSGKGDLGEAGCPHPEGTRRLPKPHHCVSLPVRVRAPGLYVAGSGGARSGTGED
jgi:hypothetical protein